MKPDFFYLQKEGVHITSQARGWTFQTPSDRSGCRLPRRRGDGPSRHRRTGAVADSPPQARGWTFQTPSDRSGCRLPRRRGDGPSRHRRTGAVADSPAGAGMDLPDTVGPERLPTPPQARGWTFQAPSDRSGCRLPRRRGDGPFRHRRTGAVADSPPQARGWTFQTPSDRSGCRLPRRRGDGPFRHRRTGAVADSPPQARGWTFQAPSDPVADSPAGAGMDLPGTVGPERLPTPPQARGWTFQAPSDRSGCRLPRRRGDGPSRHRRTGAVADSPAGAGMDLSDTVGPERLPTPPQARGWTFQAPSDRSGCRLPRRRGDGPSRHRRTGAVADSPAGAGMDLPDTVGPERLPTPPQARGWTFQTPSDRSGCRLSPAGAGMDLSDTVGPERLPTLPRRRGDGPSRHHRTGAVADSPAGAGGRGIKLRSPAESSAPTSLRW